MIFIITGKQGEGKTSWVLKLSRLLFQDFIQVGGICSIGFWKEGRRDQFHVRDLENGRSVLLCDRSDSGNGIPHHHFFFRQDGLDFGLKALQKVRCTYPDVLIIDEVGGLELESGGWAPFLETLPEVPVGVIVMVVRESLVESVIDKWHMENTRVIRIGESSPERLIPVIRQERDSYDRGRKNPVTGIILAGGRSQRFGMDKGLVKFRDKTLITIAVERFQSLCENIIISANTSHYNDLGYPVIPDMVSDCGPMMGIYSCLRQSATRVNLVGSVDTPLVPAGLFRALLSERGDSQIVVPDHGRQRYEPVIGLYDREITGAMERHFERHNYTLPVLFKEIRFKGMPVGKHFPFSNPLIFNNINTNQDLASLEALDAIPGTKE